MAAAGRIGAPGPAEVAEACRRAGFDPDPEQAAGLAVYHGFLLQWNSRMNLVGARSWQEALSDLVLDSFHLAAFLKRLGEKRPPFDQTWDLGAGAGLPGIPLRVLWQQGEYWLVESREKRALFLSTVLTRVPLPGVKVFRGRAEDFMRDRKADLVLSRAFLPWQQVLDLTGPHLKPGGLVLLLTTKKVAGHRDWQVVDSFSYPAGGNERRFTAMSPG